MKPWDEMWIAAGYGAVRNAADSMVAQCPPIRDTTAAAIEKGDARARLAAAGAGMARALLPS